MRRTVICLFLLPLPFLFGCSHGPDRFLAHLDSEATSITAAGGYIYWREYDGRIRRVSEVGGTVEAVARAPQGYGPLKVNSTDVFFERGGAIEGAPLDGTAPPRDLAGSASTYAVDDEGIYFVSGDRLFSMPSSGGTATGLLDVPTPIADLRVAGDQLAWIGVAQKFEYEVWVAGKDGASAHKVASSLDPRLLQGGDGKLYFTGHDGKLWVLDAGRAEPIAVAPGGAPTAISGGLLYAIDSGAGTTTIVERSLADAVADVRDQNQEDIHDLVAGTTGVYYLTHGFFRRPRPNESSSDGWFVQVRPAIARVP